jgi:hypothetical protein
MKQSTRVVLLATMATAGAWGQDFTATSATYLQVTKQQANGFDSKTLAPLTEFLGVDASRLGTEALSLHLFGWGFRDLGGVSTNYGGKSYGDLSYAYLEYRFKRANAQVQAGRFAVNQGAGIDQVDGVSGRTDLRGGFNVSGFAGTPVLYRTQPADNQTDYRTQNDLIFGARLGKRWAKIGELGVSYLQEGTKRAQDYAVAQRADYTRKQLGVDLRLVPVASLDVVGHTLLNVQGADRAPENARRLAENDYAVTYRIKPTVVLTGTYSERNLEAYYAATNLPNLFRADERDRHRAFGGNLAVGAADALQVLVDYRQTRRDSYGVAHRYGADLRWTVPDTKLKAGGGLHRVSAADVVVAGTVPTIYGLSRNELRGWVMYDYKKCMASLDGIWYHFSDANNPSLNGRADLTQLVASLGYRPAAGLEMSADLSYGVNAYYQRETSGLLRATYRFSASKGGK